MITDTIVRLIFSTLEFSALIFLAFSLFRIPLKYQMFKVVSIAFLLSAIYMTQTEFTNLSDYAFVTQIFFYIVCFVFIFNLPIFYGIVVSMTGYIAFGVIQISLFATFSLFNIGYEMIQQSLFYTISLQILEIIIVTLLIMWMQYRKIGFMFVANRIHFIQTTKKYNFFLTGTIIFSVVSMQLFLLFQKTNLNIIYIFSGLTVLFITGLIITYQKNKKELIQKYERFKNINE
jgi:hypothetical protein